MGSFHTLYIAAAATAETDSGLIDFDRYLALYPPVRLRRGIEALDRFHNVPLRFPAEEREARVTQILQRVVSLGADRDPEPGNPLPISALEAEFLVGLAFRLTLRDTIWQSQELLDLEVLRTPRHSMRRKPASREIL